MFCMHGASMKEKCWDCWWITKNATGRLIKENTMQTAGDALENAVKYERMKVAFSRALNCWEAWIVLASVLYLSAHFAFWKTLAFRVVGR